MLIRNQCSKSPCPIFWNAYVPLVALIPIEYFNARRYLAFILVDAIIELERIDLYSLFVDFFFSNLLLFLILLNVQRAGAGLNLANGSTPKDLCALHQSGV